MHQFSYRANRSVDDAVNMGLHYILQHLDKPGTYARITFVDFNSAFSWSSQLNSALRAHPNLSADNQQLARLGNLTSRTSPSALLLHRAASSLHCSLPVHEWLHCQRPLCQAPEVCRRHYSHQPHPRRWWVYLQTRGWTAGCLVPS